MLLTPYVQVCAGKDSVGATVNVATCLMDKKGITPKFTTDELRDKISHCKCVVRIQSCIFHQLDRNLEWTGDTISIETPVITYRSFQRKSNTFWLEVTIQISKI